jgi:hypothetical protein
MSWRSSAQTASIRRANARDWSAQSRRAAPAAHAILFASEMSGLLDRKGTAQRI